MASATDIYVTTNGTGNLSGSDWDNATSNLQGAIDTIAAGTVWVSNGVYNTGGLTNFPTGTVLTNRVAIYKAITVRSANNDYTNTIIKGAWASNGKTNGDDAVRCVYMTNGASLIGFMLTNGATMTNGATYDQLGGALECIYGPNIISNCLITGNSGKERYGTIVLGNGNLGSSATRLLNSKINYNLSPGGTVGTMRYCIISNCTVAGNKGTAQAFRDGIAYNSSIVSNTADANTSDTSGGAADSATLWNCLIGWNFASYTGAGYDACVFINCLIIGNYANYCGAAASCTLSNCTVVGNAGGRSEGNHRGGLGDMGGLPCKAYNCIIWGNHAGTLTNSDVGTTAILYNCITSFLHPAQANIGCSTNNPMFISLGSSYGSTYSTGDLHLSSSSPCVNTGTNAGWMTGTGDFDGLQLFLFSKSRQK